ncbi:MAG: chemotaxis protein CheA [Allosphingosinicella sp.]|uniref:chemotaxis protein CheA n=1 Tax=Allosphingosinicella sp. TaxID=2823234 RepID=UPI003923CAA1
MDDLIQDFIAETREMLQAISGALVAWEAAPDDGARFDEIFRFVHTVKGNCGFFDLPRLSALSHAAEDVLADVRAGRRAPDRALVSAVLGVIDRIGELVEALDSGASLPDGEDARLIAALSRDGAPLDEPRSAAAAPQGAARPIRTVRLPVELLDRIMNGVSDAVLARNELARRLREAPAGAAVDEAFERVSACLADIRDAVTRTRMQRIESLFATLPRMVRDLAAEIGKEATLRMDGGDVELDREMIEMVRDPLTHIIRNALDHGIESPADRERLGKPRAGRLSVCARQSGNQILIEICDDGRGIDGDRLVRRAVEAGLVTPERAAQLSPSQRTALIFEPGLSTAGQVTAISGRGVGMDVVRANVERIGGVVDVESRAGSGVRLNIRVPMTLTIIPALTVAAAGQVYAVPRSAIDEILRADGRSVRIEALGGARVATVRGRRMPLVLLSELLGGSAGEPRNVILVKPAGGEAYALAVDGVHDHEELVVKPAAPAVLAAGLYAGTTLAEDGRPVLLLDPSGVASVAGLASAEAEPEPEAEAAPAGETFQALLFRGLDGAARAVRLPVVERIEDVDAAAVRHSAGRLRVALGGSLLPLAGCDAPPGAGKLRLLRLTDGAAELAYAFGDVIDIRAVPADFRRSAAAGEIAGVALIDGEPVELIDPYWLFAAHGGTAAGAGSTAAGPVCALPAGDPWIEAILRPMIEGLGYRVVDSEEGVSADLVIVGDDGGASTVPPAAGGEVLRLRARPEPSGDNDNSIYRYDRDALLSALTRGKARSGDNG